VPTGNSGVESQVAQELERRKDGLGSGLGWSNSSKVDGGARAQAQKPMILNRSMPETSLWELLDEMKSSC
jgi:hypothetical protein